MHFFSGNGSSAEFVSCQIPNILQAQEGEIVKVKGEKKKIMRGVLPPLQAPKGDSFSCLLLSRKSSAKSGGGV